MAFEESELSSEVAMVAGAPMGMARAIAEDVSGAGAVVVIADRDILVNAVARGSRSAWVPTGTPRPCGRTIAVDVGACFR